jgi:hypothetical protein
MNIACFDTCSWATHLLLSINGLIGGLLLMIKPDGSKLQMDPTWLGRTPFQNYFLPGLLLFTFVGLLSMITLLGLMFKFKASILNKVNIYPEKHWGLDLFFIFRFFHDHLDQLCS